MSVRKGVKVFTLPGEEELLNEYLNNDMIDIVEELKTACPKESIILYLIKYEETI